MRHGRFLNGTATQHADIQIILSDAQELSHALCHWEGKRPVCQTLQLEAKHREPNSRTGHFSVQVLYGTEKPNT